MPAMGTAKNPAGPSAEITTVQDTREDRSLDEFLSEKPVDFVRKALAAEFVDCGTFANVGLLAGTPPTADLLIEANLREMSWAVPNHAGMVKTAFWTSFLTGGLGGLAYGSTDTPVYGHASIHLKLTQRATGLVVLDQTFDAVHEEHMAKLKCDSLETRARVMALALKAVLVKAAKAILPAATK